MVKGQANAQLEGGQDVEGALEATEQLSVRGGLFRRRR
jgi:hypothetical protein